MTVSRLLLTPEAGIAAKSLWPGTTIATAAVANLPGGAGV